MPVPWVYTVSWIVDLVPLSLVCWGWRVTGSKQWRQLRNRHVEKAPRSGQGRESGEWSSRMFPKGDDVWGESWGLEISIIPKVRSSALGGGTFTWPHLCILPFPSSISPQPVHHSSWLRIVKYPYKSPAKPKCHTSLSPCLYWRPMISHPLLADTWSRWQWSDSDHLCLRRLRKWAVLGSTNFEDVYW